MTESNVCFRTVGGKPFPPQGPAQRWGRQAAAGSATGAARWRRRRRAAAGSARRWPSDRARPVRRRSACSGARRTRRGPARPALRSGGHRARASADRPRGPRAAPRARRRRGAAGVAQRAVELGERRPQVELGLLVRERERDLWLAPGEVHQARGRQPAEESRARRIGGRVKRDQVLEGLRQLGAGWPARSTTLRPGCPRPPSTGPSPWRRRDTSAQTTSTPSPLESRSPATPAKPSPRRSRSSRQGSPPSAPGRPRGGQLALDALPEGFVLAQRRAVCGLALAEGAQLHAGLHGAVPAVELEPDGGVLRFAPAAL